MPRFLIVSENSRFESRVEYQLPLLAHTLGECHDSTFKVSHYRFCLLYEKRSTVDVT
jgi:hypothetical protein